VIRRQTEGCDAARTASIERRGSEAERGHKARNLAGEHQRAHRLGWSTRARKPWSIECQNRELAGESIGHRREVRAIAFTRWDQDNRGAVPAPFAVPLDLPYFVPESLRFH